MCSATLTTLDSANNVGKYTSITPNEIGLGLISYYDSTGGNLKGASCTNDTCTIASIYTLDSAGNIGRFTSITLGPDGMGLISYQNQETTGLKAAHCNDAGISSAVSLMLDKAADTGRSRLAGSDGKRPIEI